MAWALGDTIVAICTPPGEGAIGVVRLSGPAAIEIGDVFFRGRVPLSRVRSRYLVRGRLVDGGREVDDVLAVVMQRPASYTGEDVVEIYCHGGLLIVQRVLEAALRAGARMAERGEFTRRAFVNGKIDLAQAEAVVDLVRSRGEKGLQAAYRQMRGGLSEEVLWIRGQLVEALALLEVSLDFPDEDVGGLDAAHVEDLLSRSTRRVEGLLSSFQAGRAAREGIKVALVGKPNVGKSSLFNALLGEDRAIVTPMPGTTRDYIEGCVRFEGFAFDLTDTAGLWPTGDVVEQEGSRRSRMLVEQADIVLAVVDGSQPLDDQDMEVAETVRPKRSISILNKRDLGLRVKGAEVCGLFGSCEAVEVSATCGQGLDRLATAMVAGVRAQTDGVGEAVMVTRIRHAGCLSRVLESLKRAQDGLAQGLSVECVAEDVRAALYSLGEIVGMTISEDVLNQIFSEFCIGK